MMGQIGCLIEDDGLVFYHINNKKNGVWRSVFDRIASLSQASAPLKAKLTRPPSTRLHQCSSPSLNLFPAVLNLSSAKRQSLSHAGLLPDLFDRGLSPTDSLEVASAALWSG